MKVVIGVETKPRMQFTIEADPNNMPDLIALKDGKLLMYSARYASKGEYFAYKHVKDTLNYDGEVKEWIQYSGLKG